MRDLVVVLVVAILASALIRTYVVRSFYIPSASMENTLHVNDRILVNELGPKLTSVHRGDVVVFKDPGGWLPPGGPARPGLLASVVDAAYSIVGLSAQDSSQYLVKRVIGVAGDHVKCCNALGQLSVNGTPLKEPYAVVPPGGANAATRSFDVVVPVGSLWVMGDNRYNSRDSSLNQELPGKGFVPVTDVVGTAMAVIWPTSRWAWVDSYPATFAGLTNSALPQDPQLPRNRDRGRA
ncbi:MAG TPA: signal peptidase I [Diaminobutyricibacter sp.]